MKSSIVVSLFGAAVLFGPPAGAQVATQLPPPAALLPPAQANLAPTDGAAGPDEQPTDPVPPPTSDATAPGATDAQAGAQATASYPPPDFAPDEEIAESYDDGYNPEAYTQFQAALAPYGTWDDDATYGYVWTPSETIVGATFSPYATCGHWVLSRVGWTWVSDWSWGWAPFHYGRWITRANRWSWVPGTMWGPAWVAWRSGDGYVGWSPLPPRGVRVTGGHGASSPWRFTLTSKLNAAHPIFVDSRYLPGLFARTTVVSTDRLLTRGRWDVHVNAGPTRGITVVPVPLSRVAARVLPQIAIYPHTGLPLYQRPWSNASGSRSTVLTADQPKADPPQADRPQAAPAQPPTFGRTPVRMAPTSPRMSFRSPVTASPRHTSFHHRRAKDYGRSTPPNWAADPVRPTYGERPIYSAQASQAPAYHAEPAPPHQATPPFHPAAPAAYRPTAPPSHPAAPAFHQGGPAYRPATPPPYHQGGPASSPPHSFPPPRSPATGGGGLTRGAGFSGSHPAPGAGHPGRDHHR